MKDLREVTGKLKLVKRLNSSYFGNPRYLVEINEVLYSTTPDASLSYGISNHWDKIVTATVGTHYNVSSIQSIN
jgi:hypothetical protein